MNNKDDILAKYLVTGMIIGSLVGVIFSIIMRHNTFFSISGTGFGLLLGLIIANITWSVKNARK
ncbi:hypothetical protein [Clostridium sp.]|uniref:hypothetical protein n=1 Tax=Clostridium sp. TaxID=1506 RepID=UPI001DC962AC|nr:hypothetical protein [Clostridium sp.]MBS5937836.1 hypothetical protein [Clostridium sp.]